eukprot:12893232-Ditylum_brightwellii.AAC.1
MDEEELILLIMEANTLYLVTDGGVKEKVGYFGWVIATVMDILCKAKGHTPGPLKLMESLRTEN